MTVGIKPEISLPHSVVGEQRRVAARQRDAAVCDT